MESAVKIAAYIANRYRMEYGRRIDEMKLHKLLYFAQRESIIQLGKPLFSEQFRAWRYGPVLTNIRNLYRFGLLDGVCDSEVDLRYLPVLDKVFTQYAVKDSWSLSRLTHGEYAWQKAREGFGPIDNCENPIALEDIKVDANRIKMRRFLLSRMEG